MKSNCQDENKTIFETKTGKVIKNSDAFGLEIDWLKKIEIMSCETDETEKRPFVTKGALPMIAAREVLWAFSRERTNNKTRRFTGREDRDKDPETEEEKQTEG